MNIAFESFRSYLQEWKFFLLAVSPTTNNNNNNSSSRRNKFKPQDIASFGFAFRFSLLGV